MTALTKDDPGVSDVHVASAGGARKPKRRARSYAQIRAHTFQPLAKDFWAITVPISKTDDELRVVYGWASVIEEAGKIVTDSQGDQIASHALVKAAHGFLRDSRAAGEMHVRTDAGSIVESLVFTGDVQTALGIDLGKVGWFIGAHIPGDAEWAAVKSGKYPAFSIGGSGRRVPL